MEKCRNLLESLKISFIKNADFTGTIGKDKHIYINVLPILKILSEQFQLEHL